MFNPWTALGANGRVRFARLRALAWLAIGLVSIPTGWMNSVIAVWMASVYANIESGVAAAEAADDHLVLEELRSLRGDVAALRTIVEALAQRAGEPADE